MFGIFKKRESQMDHAQRQVDEAVAQLGASVLLITQAGKIVMISEALKSRPKDWMGGQAIEVMIHHPSQEPYFIYYENEKYYFSMAGGGGSQSLSNVQDFEGYRSAVSQTLCMFLVLHLLKAQGKDIRHPGMSFSHNRIHTNVVAYVERLSNWYPIQHSSEESDSATDRKLALVNRGSIDISEVIAINAPSPA